MPVPLITFSISLLSALPCFLIIRSSRNITYFGVGTDNEKMVRAAALYRFTSWPSRMHKHPWGRAQLRDIWVIALALVQRITRDFASDRANVILGLVSNAVVSILLFQICQNYWSMGVAFVVAILFLTSFWPYQIAIYMGHVHLSHMFLLFSVVFLQYGASQSGYSALVWYFGSGLGFGLSLFASTASRKYLPLAAGAFLFSLKGYVAAPWTSGAGLWDRLVAGDVAYGPLYAAAAIMMMVVGVSYGGYQLQRRFPYITCSQGSFWRLVRKLEPTDSKRQEQLILYAVQLSRKVGITIASYLVFAWTVSQSVMFYLIHLAAAMGFGAVFLFLMLPDLYKNASRFSTWWGMSKWITHFKGYKEFFLKRGLTIPEDMRGEGLVWIVRFFPRVLPLCSMLFIACLGYWIWLVVVNEVSLEEMWGVLGLVILSASPIIVGEVTKSLQVGKAYFAGFTGTLLFIAATLSHADKAVPDQMRPFFWFALWIVIFGHAAWNFWVFIDDVWPARMAPCWLARTLGALRIKKFYTYDNPYNNAFLNVLPSEVRDGYEVIPIRCLSEVQDGYVVVPGTSSKALNMETEGYAIGNGDFNKDPILTRLIETKEIERYAVASFKTFGTSRFFVHESEVTSYRDLILKEINEKDRWRGRAWLLDVGRLRSDGLLN